MIVLLDTSSPTCKLVLCAKNGDEVSQTDWEAGRGLAHGLNGYIRDCLAAYEKDIHDITGIGVMKGPGSFTGLRIGLTVANTLADSLGVAIVGVTGDSWRNTALQRLLDGQDDTIVLPEYGGEANITKPRK